MVAVSSHDGVGQHAIGLGEVFRSLGYETNTYVELPATNKACKSLKDFLATEDSNTIVVYHHATGSKIPDLLANSRYKVITYYQNVTPFPYFHETKEPTIREACRQGTLQMGAIRAISQEIWAPSLYSCQELRAFGFPKVYQLPIIKDYQKLRQWQYTQNPASTTRQRLLFVGRLVANKAQHDLIRLFKLYKDYFHQDTQLILVGSFAATYWQDILVYAKELNLTISRGEDASDILLLQDLSEEDLAKTYHSCQLFISTSEHEGFGIPLIEAMSLGVPVLAHPATAVTDTVGSEGCLHSKDDSWGFLQKMYEILNHPQKSMYWKEQGLGRCENFSMTSITDLYKKRISHSIPRLTALN